MLIHRSPYYDHCHYYQVLMSLIFLEQEHFFFSCHECFFFARFVAKPFAIMKCHPSHYFVQPAFAHLCQYLSLRCSTVPLISWDRTAIFIIYQLLQACTQADCLKLKLNLDLMQLLDSLPSSRHWMSQGYSWQVAANSFVRMKPRLEQKSLDQDVNATLDKKLNATRSLLLC